MPEQFLVVLIDTIAAAGGHPLCVTKSNRVLRALYRNATPEQMQVWGSVEGRQMEQVQCYVGLRGTLNSTELGDVPHAALRPLLALRVERRAHRDAHQEHALGGAALAHPFHGAAGADEHRRLRGLLLRRVHRRLSRHGPFHGAAAAAHGADRPGASRRTGHRPALLDSRHSGGRLLRRSQHPRRRDVHQPGARLGGGHPDLQHPQPQPRRSCSTTFASSFPPARSSASTPTIRTNLEQILDTDAGARYIGEFSLGFNPRIMNPMLDTLFDEKIAGSFHFTPGQAYEEADNGNRSEVHWDLGGDSASGIWRRRDLLRRAPDPQGRAVRAGGAARPQPVMLRGEDQSATLTHPLADVLALQQADELAMGCARIPATTSSR